MITITLDGFHNREAHHWNGNGNRIRTNARRHAREHGAAGMLFADDRFTLFYREGDSVKQKTWRSVNVWFNGKLYSAA